MNTYKYIYEDLKQTITNGEDMESIRDNSGEWIDGYLPVYNNNIIEEWKDMPGEYDDRGYAELGNPEEMTIVRLMSLDLYLYYSDIFFQVLTDIAEELESVA
jgi:predicted RNase H-like HicB family nuclease